jgi:hypothetical protein
MQHGYCNLSRAHYSVPHHFADAASVASFRYGSIYVSVPPGIREWLDAELKESLYLSRMADGETVLVEAP